MLMLGCNPPHRLLREFIKRGDAEFEVFFLRVLDLVVADAVQALNEHHHGRHTRRRDFGGVVQRPAWQAMRLTPKAFGDGFVAQRDEIVVEWARRDLPETFPRDAHVAFLGEAFAGDFGFLQHFCQRGGIEMALIERDPTFLDDAGDDAGFGGA